MSENPERSVPNAAICGVVAAMAMSGIRELTMALGLVRKPPPDEIADEGAPGVLRKIPAGSRDAAIELAHWGYGAAGGVVFCLLPGVLRRQPWIGAVYGLAAWGAFEGLATRAFDLEPGSQRPTRERVAVALDHVLYGTIVALGSVTISRRD